MSNPANAKPSELRNETEKLIDRAGRVMSSRQSNVRALPEPSIFVETGIGQRVWDVDGQEFLDYAIAMGPGIWGHGHREYLDSIRDQIEKLVYVQSGACQSRLEVALAEKLVEHVPSIEHVRFHLSGSEAVQMTFRLARAYTGKPWFLRFGGHYHGWLDNVMGGVMDTNAEGPPHAVYDENDPFFTAGRHDNALQESLMIPWNDEVVLAETLEKYGDRVAVVVMEVFCSNGGCSLPKPGYLQAVRDLCDKHDVLLCFDEIITGFRTAIGGAQSIVGIQPDLTIFGKAIAGGMPLAAIGGRQAVFDLFRTNKVIGAGTFNAFPVSMAAALKTLQMLERDDGVLYKQREAIQRRLESGLKRAAQEAGHDLITLGIPGNFCTHFTNRTDLWTSQEIYAASDVEKAVRFRQLLRDEGIIQGLGNRWFVSFALTDKDVAETVKRASRALGNL